MRGRYVLAGVLALFLPVVVAQEEARAGCDLGRPQEARSVMSASWQPELHLNRRH